MQPGQNKIDGNRIDLRQASYKIVTYLFDQVTKMAKSKSNSAYDGIVCCPNMMNERMKQIEPK